MKRLLLLCFLCLPALAGAASCEIADKSLCKSAERGNAEAQLSLGYMYYSGEADRQDSKQAFQWFKKAAENGNSIALNWLGKMYFEGEVDQQDYANTFNLFKKKAEQGNASAQFYLGNMYKEGIGIKKNYRQAFLWIEKAAKQGNADAQFELGLMTKDTATAGKSIKWLHKAAEQGHAEAQFELGSIYHHGSLNYYGTRGIEKDKKNAIYWYEKALSNGENKAKKRLDELSENDIGVMNSIVNWGKNTITGESEDKELKEDKFSQVVVVNVSIGSRQVGSYRSGSYYTNKRICDDAINKMYVVGTNGITLSASCQRVGVGAYDAPLDEVSLAGVTYMGYQLAHKFSTYKTYSISDMNECKSSANHLKISASKEPSGFFGIFFCIPQQNSYQVLYGRK